MWRNRTPEETEDLERQAALEAESTRLLREADAFRWGGGVRSPRSEAEERRATVEWTDWMAHRVVELYPGLEAHFDAVAEALRLTEPQKAALRLHRLEGLTLKEAAAVMGTRVWRVRELLKNADRKCGLRRHEPPVSAKALYWQEVRQKCAAVYRSPVRWRPRPLSKKEARKLLGTRPE